MGTADIVAAINSIPAKKENLRKAFENLQSYSSSLFSFNLQWKDIDDHLSSIEKAIDERFQELKVKNTCLVPKKPAAARPAANVKKEQDMTAVEPRPELKSPCMNMDAKGLRSYIIGNRKDVQAMRKAFEDLQSYSSSLFSFNLQWKDIDDHLSSIEKSIDERFQELKVKNTCLVPKKPAAARPAANVKKEQDMTAVEPRPELKSPCMKMDAKGLRSYIIKPAAARPAANVKKEQDMTAVEPRPELKSPCMKMDAKGLRSYIIWNRKDVQAMRSELGPALLSSPDPVTLVLDSFDGFVPSTGMTEGEVQAIRRGCLTIMECFHGLALEIKPSDRKRAKEVAEECEELIIDGKRDNAVVVLVFLQLVATFGLVEFFAIDDLLDLLVTVVRKKCIVDLCRNSALEEKIPDLIIKLNNKRRHLDSLKFVFAFNLLVKYPPASLFKAYIKESTRASKKRMHENAAASNEIFALRAVIKAVEEYNLGFLYPRENLQKRIEELQKQKSERKRVPPAIVSHQPPNKRPRPSSSAAYPHSQNQLQLDLVDRAPYAAGLASSYNLSGGPSLYSHGSASLSGNPIGLGGSLASPKPYLYPSESPAGSSYYDRPLSYGGGYSQSGLSAPAAYNPSSPYF